MASYDFNILSPAEFETLSRDLLQKELKTHVESFTTGRDGGIDLRCSKLPAKNIIIQAKRYKTWNSLKSELKKEVAKVRKLNPSKYILTTAVGLTPQNKSEIMTMFDPYIKAPADIYGRDDLNNLLGQYADVEKDHYKLWLSSSAILERIVHRDAENWSTFALEEVKRKVAMYVMNPSFPKALNILKENRYVIISGIPGIGKTTLAQMLAYDLLARGFEEFHYIPGDIDNAAKMFEKGKKQVFFYDDFLGATALESHEPGFADKLLLLIRMIRDDKSKALILTTREYILSDGFAHYEKLAQENVEIAKCVLDLGSYTKKIRAQILYNHIYAAGLPEDYIEKFLEGRRYHKILDHPNFNPRIIETFVDKGQWRMVEPGEFMDRFIRLLDNPHDVWRMAFEQLSPEARYALLVLVTMRQEVRLQDWRQAFLAFCSATDGVLHLNRDDLTWKRSIKVLSDCFIKTERRADVAVVSVFNPSVRDFAVSLVQESVELQRQLIEGGYFPEQLTEIFGKSDSLRTSFTGRVDIGRELWPLAKDKFLEYLESEPRTCDHFIGQYVFIEGTPNLPAFAVRFIKGFSPWDADSGAIISEKVLRLAVEAPASQAGAVLDLIKWFKWPQSRDMLQQLKMENLYVDNYADLLETMQETCNSDLAMDASFVDNMDRQMMEYADSSLDSEMAYARFENTYNRVSQFLPDNVSLGFTEDAMKEALERLSAPEAEEEEDAAEMVYNNADCQIAGGSRLQINQEIDSIMDGLLGLCSEED